jgi:hypothetical protein
MEKHAIKRPLESEGIPPLIENPEEAMEIFAEILRRGAMFYTDANDATQGHQRVHRIVKAQGNPSIVIVGDAMTKLLHIIYGMLKHGQPLDHLPIRSVRKNSLPHLNSVNSVPSVVKISVLENESTFGKRSKP